ncbi:hypothetical protein BDY19DRAFT_997965 [Irpex rosettiformis]|uniref:Uncharacterized protein n=1 Tax=Irpex rosettiformis TaxID=378272 RepID=A0ACB8TPX7_9APHY|nr:hypothetical protein BDY19DRAFT_997965 [Irpex rosettiformis]
MATASAADRADIHKSCKGIEGVVNLLNDYCDAATAIVAIQKKLAKAVREAASIRCTSEIAMSALNACATVVETLVDVDARFVKAADKECDSLSADVKKWFKVLAKEERSHDAKLAVANEKIKQAGQTYEKRVKKNPANAAEEHTRYINVLGAVGPEISEERYHHATSVFQQHARLVLSMAVSVSRIIDAEWLRACDEVRKIAPSIGQVGQWKVFCEGGWSGPIPGNLLDIDLMQEQAAMERALKARLSTHDPNPNRMEDVPTTPHDIPPVPAYASRATTPVISSYSSTQQPTYFSQKKALDRVAQQIVDVGDKTQSQAVDSFASLGSFPTPPTHFPIPPVSNSKPSRPIAESNGKSSERQYQSNPPVSCESSSKLSTLEPPALKQRKNSTNTDFPDFTSPYAPQTSNQITLVNSQQSRDTTMDTRAQEQRASGSPSSQLEKIITSSHPSISAPSSIIRPSQIYKRGDYMDSAEFGVRKVIRAESVPEEPLRTNSPNSAAAERRNVNRSNSSVSVMRDKFARTTGPASPPPKDIPRLPLSVSNLATRYEAVAETQDRRQEAKSPIEDRRLSTDVRHGMPQGRESPVTQRSVMPSPQLPSSSYSSASPGLTDDEIARRRDRKRELEVLDFCEKEHELRLQEREIQSCSRELEKDGKRLLMTRTYRSDHPTQAREDSQNLVESPSSSPIFPSRYPFPMSANQLRTQPTPGPAIGQRLASAQSSSSQSSSPSVYHPPTNHPDTCGCEVCSVAKYNTRPSTSPTSTTGLRPPDGSVSFSDAPIKIEKPKGWIRRLSMPAFSSDSKKGISSANYMSGGEGLHRNSLAVPDEDGRLRSLVVDSKNRSVTNLIGRR